MATASHPALQVREAWDAVADDFDRHTTPLTLALGSGVVARLGIAAGMQVLDVAAGSGALSIPAARAGAQVTAVDIAPTMIARLAARAAALDLPVRGLVGDATALQLDDDTFDVVMSLNGISVVDDLAAGLGEAARVARPGGQVAVAAFGPLPEVEFVAFFLAALRAAAGEAWTAPPGPLPPFRLADPGDLAGALEDVGLAAVEVETLAWETTFSSVDHLMATLLGSNPIAGRLLAGLGADARDRVRAVLDGMLRERSGGAPGATLHNRINLARGTA